jgi:hypothetical protein
VTCRNVGCGPQKSASDDPAMIPALSHPSWEKLIKGEIKHKFSNAAASMLFFHLQSQYKRDPSRLDDHIAQAHAFFVKYERVLADEIRAVFGR